MSGREEHGGLIGRWGSYETVGRCHWVEGMLGLETPPLGGPASINMLPLPPPRMQALPRKPWDFVFPLGSRLCLQAKVCPGDKRIWSAGQTGGRENPPGLWLEEWVGLRGL